MNYKRIEYYNKLTGKEEDNKELKKYKRNKTKMVHRRIEYYNQILRRLEEEKKEYEIKCDR